MTSPFLPLPGTRARRRIYLMRHGQVAYYDSEGRPLNPKTVCLTEQGCAQARAAGAMLGSIALDQVVCSGLPRTRQTAELVVAGRDLPVLDDPAFVEIRAGRLSGIAKEARESAYLYGMEQAAVPGAQFAGGDVFAEVQRRVEAGIVRWLQMPGWTRLLLVAHDGVNRMLLAWACGVGLAGLAAFEQDYGCVNILDIDVDLADGQIKCRMIRATNITPATLAKDGLYRTSGEEAFTPLLLL